MSNKSFFSKIINWWKSTNNKIEELKNKEEDAKVEEAFGPWEDSFMDLLQATRKLYVKNGRDTKEVDDLIERSKKKK